MDCSIVRGWGVEELTNRILCSWKALSRALIKDQCSLVECDPVHKNPSKPQLVKPGEVQGICWIPPSELVEEEHVWLGQWQHAGHKLELKIHWLQVPQGLQRWDAMAGLQGQDVMRGQQARVSWAQVVCLA